MADLKNDANARQWMAQWKHAAKELPRIRARELRELTDDQATQIAIGLAPPLPYRLSKSSGLQKWQMWMSKLARQNATEHEQPS